jgi:poly-beta-hydroxybutyrate-responsive repressor
MQFSECACSGKNLARQVRPAVLAVLAGGEEHGYLLVQKLAQLSLFGENETHDPSGVYRVLKQMEEEGLVTSAWDTESGGPARRMYALTDAGLACLTHWVSTLEEYVAGLQQLVDMMRSACRRPQEE